jgi:hypothetical protein
MNQAEKEGSVLRASSGWKEVRSAGPNQARAILGG